MDTLHIYDAACHCMYIGVCQYLTTALTASDMSAAHFGSQTTLCHITLKTIPLFLKASPLRALPYREPCKVSHQPIQGVPFVTQKYRNYLSTTLPVRKASAKSPTICHSPVLRITTTSQSSPMYQRVQCPQTYSLSYGENIVYMYCSHHWYTQPPSMKRQTHARTLHRRDTARV